MRLRKVKDAAEKIANYPLLAIQEPTQFRGSWNTVFQNNNPIHIEIGMGKGKFLLELATINPNLNYIGIEKFDSVMIRAVEKIFPLNLNNIRLINVDAVDLIQIFSHGEIGKIYLNFSDPWPKSRQEKRRLTSNTFLPAYQTILSSDGDIELKTDNAKLFEYSVKNLNQNGLRFLDFSVNLHGREEVIITTEYEERFTKLGQPIYYLKTTFRSE